MDYTKLQDKCRGSLVGGAVGDALGYEVEFMSLSSIRKRFGEKGITRYVLHNGVAEFSDDTQMSLFTAEGLLNGTVRNGILKWTNTFYWFKEAYLNWYDTQTKSPHPSSDSWLSHLKPLWNRRAPGLTCLSSLETYAAGNDNLNDSKGCGGVMRVAPIGIYFAAHPEMKLSEGWERFESLVTIASNAAFITHGHTASCYSSALLATIIDRCIRAEFPINEATFRGKVESGLIDAYEHIPLDECWIEFKELINKAISLAESDTPDNVAISQLGDGWVADEAIAIAIFSVMRHIDNFENCIVCAVNHDGDSDSTGAIAGNIIGAIVGYNAIPEKYLTNLELHDVLISVADDLGGFSSDVQMKQRYMAHKPFNVNENLLI